MNNVLRSIYKKYDRKAGFKTDKPKAPTKETEKRFIRRYGLHGLADSGGSIHLRSYGLGRRLNKFVNWVLRKKT